MKMQLISNVIDTFSQRFVKKNIYLTTGIHGQKGWRQHGRGRRNVQNEALAFLGHFRQQQQRHASNGENVAVHQPGAESTRVRQVAQKFRIRVRHADIVYKDADIQILQLDADFLVDMVVFGEINVNDPRLDTILLLCGK